MHLDLAGFSRGDDLAEHYRAICRAGERERLAAFGNAIRVIQRLRQIRLPSS